MSEEGSSKVSGKGTIGGNIDERISAREARMKEWESVAGDEIVINFELPNGEKFSDKFTTGRTVADLKVEIQRRYDMPYEAQTLLLEGNDLMIDPLSLSDIPAIAAMSGKEINVLVKGALE